MKKIKLSEKVQPMYSDVFVSLITEIEESKSGLIIPEEAKHSMVSDVQKVMAIGTNVTQVEVGQQVKLKMRNLLVIKSDMVKGKTSQSVDEIESKKFILDPERIHTIDGVEYLLVREGDIAYKVLDSNI